MQGLTGFNVGYQMAEDHSETCECGHVTHKPVPAASVDQSVGAASAAFTGFTEGQTPDDKPIYPFCMPVIEAMDNASGDHKAFIGMILQIGLAIIDTGAQHGLIGKEIYDKFCEALENMA